MVVVVVESVAGSGGSGMLHGVCYFVFMFCIYAGVSGCISLLSSI